jgi:hypothetical protein
MELTQINYFAVFVAALSSFVIGFLWYAPFSFGNIWMKEAGISEERAKQASMVKIFGFSFLLSLVICFNLAAFLGQDAGLIWGITAGALAGIGWVSASIGIVYLFESRSLKLFLINAGYQAITYMVSGGIIGIWQ